jgi:beta propeller repeat protein
LPERRLGLVAWLFVVLTAGALAPLAAAHTTSGPTDVNPFANLLTDQSAFRPPSAGYTGPGSAPWINFYQGAWVYGQVGAAPLGNQTPQDIHGSGDWLVWEDAASSDIFAFNTIAGTGQYITRDPYLQRNPDVSGNTVVWEDYRNPQHSDIYAYFFDTGETKRLSSGPGNKLQPTIDGHLVAWEDDRNGTGDIWGYDLDNQTEFPIYVGPDREMDPLVLGDTVYFRTYRFNVFDIMAVNVRTGEVKQITSDLAINNRPFTNGQDVFFLTQYYAAWQLDRYIPSEDRVVHTPAKFQFDVGTPIVGDRIVYATQDLGYSQLIALNTTTGLGTHISGSLATTTDPWLTNRTAYVPVQTANGTTLLSIDVSPFSFSRHPEIQLTSPASGSPWAQVMNAAGAFHIEADWGTPTTFTYRVDDGLPQAIAYQDRFRVPLDPATAYVDPTSGQPLTLQPGTHVVTFRATFREGPPVEASLILVVPDLSQQIDLAAQAPLYHRERVAAAVNAYITFNPASWFIIALVLLLIALIAIRVWLVLRPKRRRVSVEYVRPYE